MATELEKRLAASMVLKKALTYQFLENLENDDIKRLAKKLKESAKEVRTGKLRKFFTSADYISLENVVLFLKLQQDYFYEQWNLEKEKAWKFLNDEEEVIKAGWYTRKPQLDKLLEWADNAYPKAKSDFWDVEFEQYLLDNRN